MIDGRHARVVEQTIAVLHGLGWTTEAEVTFSEYGERGSIDVFAAHGLERAVFVGEAKSEWGSVEETNRTLDVKARLAPKIALDRFGWRPACVAKVLIFEDNGANRRVAARHGMTMDSVYRARSREVRAWL